jgi:hypothetical protein
VRYCGGRRDDDPETALALRTKRTTLVHHEENGGLRNVPIGTTMLYQQGTDGNGRCVRACGGGEMAIPQKEGREGEAQVPTGSWVGVVPMRGVVADRAVPVCCTPFPRALARSVRPMVLCIVARFNGSCTVHRLAGLP